MSDFSELADGLKSAEELTEKAMRALRLYRDAVNSCDDPRQLERLRQDAEFLIQALGDFQLQVLGLAQHSFQ